MAVNPVPDGYHTVTPYLFAHNASRVLDFAEKALDAKVTARKEHPDGAIMHAELKIGDSMVMVGEASAEFGAMPSSIYLYVADCDSVYEKALANGGESVFDMMNLPNGERYGGVKDACGNIWWIASHVEDVSPEEEARRWSEFQR